MKRMRGVNWFLYGAVALLAACSQALVLSPLPSLNADVLTETGVSVGAQKSRSPVDEELKKEGPIIKLVRRIVATDDLENPKHLFEEAIGLENYDVHQMKWGVRAVSRRSKEFDVVFRGIESIEYSRTDRGCKKKAKRYLGIILNTRVSCLEVGEVVSGFGGDFVVAPPHIVAPIGGVLGGERGERGRSVPGLIYDNIALLDGSLGRVGFYFYHGNCVDYIAMGF